MERRASLPSSSVLFQLLMHRCQVWEAQWYRFSREFLQDSSADHPYGPVPRPLAWWWGTSCLTAQPTGFPAGASCGTGLAGQQPRELVHCRQQQAQPSP